MQLILPMLIPLLAAALSLLAWRHLWVQRSLGVAGVVGQLGSGAWLLHSVSQQGIQVAQLGGWAAPFGITLVADHLSGLMVLVTGIIGTAVSCYSLVDIDRERQSFAYFPLLNVMLMGVAAVFLAGDVFNLYVWIEVLLISSFVLLALGSQREQLEGALEYVTLNLASSFVLLVAVGILYGAVGTLNMADASQRLAAVENHHLVLTIAMLFVFTFGIKAAIFPLFFWLPASYHTPPAAVSAAFAGLLTKVGVYAIVRMFTLLFTQVELVYELILALSGLTMLVGVLGAVAQVEFRKILSFHSISQMGYMIFGLGLLTPLGIAGAIFYVVHHSVVKTNLFLIAGVVHSLKGHYLLGRLGGIYQEKPWLALLFAISALSLAGIPPLSGFVAKLCIIKAGIEAGQYVLVATAAAVGLLTLYSMNKIFFEVFWKPAPPQSSDTEETSGEHPTRQLSLGELAVLVVPVAALAFLAVLLGLLGNWLFAITTAAAQELLNPQQYIQAVLGT